MHSPSLYSADVEIQISLKLQTFWIPDMIYDYVHFFLNGNDGYFLDAYLIDLFWI